uniref:p4 n=1 Tax=Tomato chlorosis virus TaxID=67754 RepID=A0A0D5NSZ5_9CLOS|nr:p4 [Tomato chlorosis virus]WOJ43292.1 small hydrophobic protein [Cucumber mosaic virus]AJS10685.1 p4 [Tomato chlorosis virus]AJS10694.1 p4 [Tomato chlorosis virus]AJS10703.1 p4 [Tomato chlorosis virus]
MPTAGMLQPLLHFVIVYVMVSPIPPYSFFVKFK